MERNYYEILGVSQDTSCAEIELMYSDSANTLKGDAKEAYEVLTNINSRVAYDKWLNTEKNVRYDYVNGEFYEAPTEQELVDNEKAYNLLFLDKEVVKKVLHNERQYDLDQTFADPENQEKLNYAEAIAHRKEVYGEQMLQAHLAQEINDMMNEDETAEVPIVEQPIVEEKVDEPTVVEGKKSLKTKVKVALCTLAAGAMIGAVALIAKSCGNENAGSFIPIGTPDEPTITPTEAPDVTPEVTPTPTEVPEVTPEVTPIVINPEEVTQLDSENIDVVTNYIVEQNKAKGLEVKAEEVKAALVFTNVASISKDELKEMTVDTDSETEYNKACNYFVAVQSHNIKNAMMGKDMNQFIALSSISYSDTDKHLLQSLDAYSVWLIENNNRGTLTSEDYQSSFKNIMNFYFEIGQGLIVGDMRYPYSDLSAGGKFIAEMMSPNFTVPYTLSSHATQENLDVISSIENRIIDGVEYMNEMFDLYEGQKTYTK